MKCQKCTKAATLHITEVLTEEQYEELHLCEECAQKYLYQPQTAKPSGKAGTGSQESEESGLPNRECSYCGIKFVEFRNSGRLGCPHDYDEFREALSLLLKDSWLCERLGAAGRSFVQRCYDWAVVEAKYLRVPERRRTGQASSLKALTPEEGVAYYRGLAGVGMQHFVIGMLPDDVETAELVE